MSECKFCGAPLHGDIPEEEPDTCDRCWEVHKRIGLDMPIQVLNKIVRSAREKDYYRQQARKRRNK